MNDLPEMDDGARLRVEAAVLRKLLEHLQKYPEVQNIDLMNLAYFCRNCISKWYRSAAEQEGVALDYDQAREIVYGMPFADYKGRYQEPATPDKLAAFQDAEQKATE
jgi:uncharacterized protein